MGAVCSKILGFDFIVHENLKNKKNIKEILSFSCVSLIGTLSSMSGRYISTMLTGIYISAKEVGYYSTILSVTMALSLVSNAVSMVLFPSMSRYYGKEDYASIRSTLNDSTRWLLIVSSFLCGIAVIFSRFIFSVVTGTDNQIGVFTLQILIVGTYIGINGVPSISSLSGTKYVYIPSIAALMGLTLSIISWRMLIPRYGIIGTAFGFVVLSAATTSIAMYYARKILLNKLFKNLEVGLFSVCILVSSILFGKYLFPPHRSHKSLQDYCLF